MKGREGSVGMLSMLSRWREVLRCIHIARRRPTEGSDNGGTRSIGGGGGGVQERWWCCLRGGLSRAGKVVHFVAGRFYVGG